MHYFSEVLDALDEPLFVLDAQGVALFMNASFMHLVGYQESEEFPSLEVLWPGCPPLSSISSLVAAEFVSRSGVILSMRLVVKELSGVGYVICVQRKLPADDISLGSYQSQRLETLGMLAGGVAHDFNNILAGILGHITYLKTILPGAGEHIESLQAIEDGARKASGITQQILDFSRLDTEEHPQRVDLQKLVESTCRLMRGALNPEYRIDFVGPSNPVVVLGVEARLAQVVANLVVNARDASVPDSTIEVHVKDVAAGEDLTDLFQCDELSARSYGVIEVTDYGEGIPDEIREQVFEPYFTTKAEKGTGLGLATVRAIVHLFGGEIQLESTEGEGTCVRVFLPIVENTEIMEQVSSAEDAEPLERGTESILVIDDEQPVRNVLMMSLKHLGYQVTTAASGLEAIELYKESKSSFDLVILDMLMPRLPGDEVFEVLQELDPDVRVLVISGFSSEEAVNKILSNGGLGFIQKPFTIDELSRKVRDCFR